MGKKKANLNKMSLEELERYIQQLKEPLVVKPVKKNKGGGLNAAIDRVKRVQGMQKGGPVPKKEKRKRILPTVDIATPKSIGQSLIDSLNRKRAEKASGLPSMSEDQIFGQSLKELKEENPQALTRLRQRRNVTGMEEGGEVPKKFKGFSKLPENVQQKMDPVAAAKYEDGGEVRGMGRAYRGAPRKAKIR